VSSLDVKRVAGLDLDDFAALHSDGSPARHDQSNMFHSAERLTKAPPNMLRPFPARVVCGPPDRQVTNSNDLEFPLVESTHLIGLFKSLQHNVIHLSLHNRNQRACFGYY
jgi:hypothetical protein